MAMMKGLGDEQTQEIIRDMLILLLAEKTFVDGDTAREARERLVAVGILTD